MLSEAEQIKLVILDVDGVLTDGSVGYGPDGGGELKFFNVHDGAGLAMLRRAGIKVAWLTGRESNANRKRANELHIDLLQEGCRDKRSGVRELAAHFGILPEECAYLGDDLIDLAAMAAVGLPVAVGDAVSEVKAAAKWVLEKSGGHGAVREFSDRLLKVQGLYDDALKSYQGEQ